MLSIKKKYLTDDKRRPIAVQVDIETFEKIEQVIEDYALGQLIDENSDSDRLSLHEAEVYYKNLRNNESSHK